MQERGVGQRHALAGLEPGREQLVVDFELLPVRVGLEAGAGPPSGVAVAQAFLIAEISNSRVTLSLTRTPPVSSAAFQVMP